MTNDLQADLTADLLSDLDRRTALPSAPELRALATAPTRSATPAVTVTLTPLRWSLPSLASTERGVGMAVRVGPWRVEVAL